MNSHENWVMIFHWNQDWWKLTRDFRMLLTQACSTRKYVSSRELTNSPPSYIVEQRNTLRKDRERVSACSCCCGLQWLPFHYVRLIFIILNNKNKTLNCDQNASELFCPGIIASKFNCDRVTTTVEEVIQDGPLASRVLRLPSRLALLQGESPGPRKTVGTDGNRHQRHYFKYSGKATKQ